MGHFRELIHDHENEMISGIVSQLENKILAKVMPKELKRTEERSVHLSVLTLFHV